MKCRSIPNKGGLRRLCLNAACLLLAAFWGACGAAAADRAVITVAVNALSSVDHDLILLGDIARIEGADAERFGRLKAVIIGKSPLPGSFRNLSTGEVSVRLKQAGIDTDRIFLVVPETAAVTRRSVTITGDRIKTIVGRFIRQNLSDTGAKTTIKQIRAPDTVLLPDGRVHYEVASSRKGDLIGTFPVGITFRVNESFEKKVWTTVTVEALVDAVVTVRALGRYRPITSGDVAVRKIDLSDLPANVITDPREVIGKRTRRAVPSEQVLRTDMVELPPLVKRGDMVKIVAQSEGLKITTLGQVKKKGRLGERIPVINMDSQKVIFARVLDAKTVAVDF